MVTGGENVSDVNNVNFTDTMDLSEVEQIYVTIRQVQTVMIPIICGIGIVGNALAVGAFFSASLRTTSCCLYLGVKSIVDVGFLLSLLIVWTYQIHLSIFHINGVCQLTVFLSYICAFLSVWFVVIITFENFVRISQPKWVPIICTPRKARIVITVCIALSLCLYNFPLWTLGIGDRNGSAMCSTRVQFNSITIIMTYVDTALTLILPSVLMLVLVPLITFNAVQVYERKKRLFHHLTRRLHKSLNPETKVTKLLFAVSFVFLVLHTPSHGIRMKLMIMEFLNSDVSYTDGILQRLFEIFYYLDFCCSLGVYLFFGDNFRKVFVKMYLKRWCKSTDNAELERVSNYMSGDGAQRGISV